MAQTVKNPPARRETWVGFLSWEDPLERGLTTYSIILAWRIPWTVELGGLQSTGRKQSDVTERLHFHFHFAIQIASCLLKKTNLSLLRLSNVH